MVNCLSLRFLRAEEGPSWEVSLILEEYQRTHLWVRRGLILEAYRSGESDTHVNVRYHFHPPLLQFRGAWSQARMQDGGLSGIGGHDGIVVFDAEEEGETVEVRAVYTGMYPCGTVLEITVHPLGWLPEEWLAVAQDNSWEVFETPEEETWPNPRPSQISRWDCGWSWEESGEGWMVI